MKVLHKLRRRFEPMTVFAHCDIPCGIYKAEAMVTAAETVHKMVVKIEELSPEQNHGYHNSVARFVHAKEEHAALCKKELLILWTDYFKPEHLTKFPDLHDKFWKAAKLCGRNKQEVSLAAADALMAAIGELAEIYESSKA